MQFSLCPFGPYCVIYFVCVYFACLCGLWPLMYIIITKTLKNFWVDCWLDLGQMDLESRQPSYAKGLGQCQLVEKSSACNLNFIWYIFEDLSKFICNMIIVKLLFWTCDLWNSSATWAILKKIMKWIGLDEAFFIWCLALQDNIIVHLCVAWF
jgi:hypothetical protein